MTDLFELKLSESPMKEAMDVYYDQFDALVNAASTHKVVLTSNVVDFPIRSGTPLYNSYVARVFGDRCIDKGSPNDVGSSFMEATNVADSYSVNFTRLIEAAMVSVNAELDQQSLNRIEESDRKIKRYDDELFTLINDVMDDWDAYRQANLANASQDEINIRQTAWLDVHRLRRRMASLANRIDRELVFQERVVSMLGNAEDTRIYRAFNNLRNSTAAYPTSPDLESRYDLDPIRMGNPLLVGLNPSWADVGASMNPMVDWENLLTVGGQRNFRLTSSSTHSSTHETRWKASASKRFGFFFRARINASEHTKMKETLTDTKEIGMSFKRISEVWLRRGAWYDTSVFDLPKVKEILKNNKRLAANLKYSVSSLIIGRGFTLTMQFNDSRFYDYFRQFSASGSATLLGMIPFGSGSSSSTSTRTENDDTNRAVNFIDDDTLCRVLGFKVDTVHEEITDEEVIEELGLFDIEGPEFQSFLVKNFGVDQKYNPL